MTDPALCLLHRGPATPTHGRLCEHHWQELGQLLRQVEDEAAILSAIPSMAQAQGSRGGTLASERAPARLAVLAHTDPRTTAIDDGDPMSILGTLAYWAERIRWDRNLRPRETLTVTGERKLLTQHLDYMAEQGWVVDLHHDLRTLRTQLQAANGTAPPKPEGRCYLPRSISGEIYSQTAEDLKSPGQCGGPIWLDTANGHAHCGTCHSTWDGPQLAHLKWELDRAKAEAARPHTPDGRPMMRIEELAHRLGVSVNAAYIRATRRGATGHNGWYDIAAFTAISTA